MFLFDHVAQILLWAAQFAILLAVAAALYYPARIARRKRLPPGRWKATVTAAQKHQSDYYDRDYSTKPVRGEVAVRIVRPGGEFLTIGAIRMDEADFEAKLSALVSDAEERAAALNANEEILR
jgi:hypothetical protein